MNPFDVSLLTWMPSTFVEWPMLTDRNHRYALHIRVATRHLAVWTVNVESNFDLPHP